MKLAMIGGGGFRVPLVYGALLDAGGISEFALYDVDPTRTDTIAGVLAGLPARSGPAGPAGSAGAAERPVVTRHTDLDDALRDATFVFVAIRVGGLTARAADERAARRLGLVGQETAGAAGIRFALRTVPVVLELAERIRAMAPDAWTVNFTNPAGLVTEAMSTVLGDRVVGICDTPAGMFARVAAALRVAESDVWFDYFGLNHLGWLRSALVDGRDRLPELIADPAALADLPEAQLIGPQRITELGLLPNEYLHFYYNTAEAVAVAGTDAPTRGEYLLAQQQAFYATATAEADRAAAIWDAARRERSDTYLSDAVADRPPPRHTTSVGYEQVAVDVLRALAGGQPVTLVLDTRNRGALPGLDADAVVEVPCLVDSTGTHPFAVGAIPDHAATLIGTVKAVERLTIEAARTGSRQTAVRALATHPLVGSEHLAERLLD